MGDLYFLRGKARVFTNAQAAIEDFTRYLIKHEWDWKGFLERGRLRVGTGDGEGGIADLLEARTRSSWSQEPYVALVDAFLKGNNAGAALEHANEFIKLNPGSPVAYSQRARVHREMDELALAREDLERAIHLSPRLPEAERWHVRNWRGELARCCIAMGDWNSAEAELTELIENGYDHLRCQRAKVRTERGDLEGAVADYSSVIEEGQLVVQLRDLNDGTGLSSLYHKRAQVLLKMRSFKAARHDLLTEQLLLEIQSLPAEEHASKLDELFPRRKTVAVNG